ncbi:MAG TPA: nuclear transport factor 2 family protein [Gemmatimonadales bacterium]|nr:nuclear transport factor 2 family protein [Gemmatimonadales bacterium]
MTGPISTVEQLTHAINQGDLEAALALYEPNAVLMVQPNQPARGTLQLREALAGFIALKPMLRSDAQHVIEAGDIALYVSRWTLKGTDPSGQSVTLGGESTDILRRQANGRWLIALDNPWGVQLLAAR